MTIEEFNNKSLRTKLLMVKTRGKELAREFTKFGPTKLMICYAINNLLVEKSFDIDTRELDVIAFNDGESLHRYTFFMTRGILNDNGFDDAIRKTLGFD